MYKRLYFLFPNSILTQSVVTELMSIGISHSHIHATAKAGVDLGMLPTATLRQRQDWSHKIEHWLWQMNLATFSIALVIGIVSLFQQQLPLLLAMLFIMLVTFILGYLWAQVPDMPVAHFKQEMSHGEILLMVDVPNTRVHEIEQLVHRHHPEAISSGSSWMIDAFEL